MHYANGYNYRNKLHSDFDELLCSEAKKRGQRKDWILDERTAMCDAVNLHRARLGKGPLAITEIERKEQLAVGHSDYGRKFALYCTELVENTP